MTKNIVVFAKEGFIFDSYDCYEHCCECKQVFSIGDIHCNGCHKNIGRLKDVYHCSKCHSNFTINQKHCCLCKSEYKKTHFCKGEIVAKQLDKNEECYVVAKIV